jgi:hypothetical protein
MHTAKPTVISTLLTTTRTVTLTILVVAILTVVEPCHLLLRYTHLLVVTIDTGRPHTLLVTFTPPLVEDTTADLLRRVIVRTIVVHRLLVGITIRHLFRLSPMIRIRDRTLVISDEKKKYIKRSLS